jgi:hypothetical protein
MEAIMDGNEKSRFDPQQQALFRQWITSPAAGYVRQNPDGTPYREPQPTLTDEEREAIERLCEAVTEYSDIDRKENGCHADDDMAAVAVARGLLERTH